MSLLETLEETKKQLEALEGKAVEEGNDDAVVESDTEESKDENEEADGDSESSGNTETKEEAKKEEPKVEAKKEEPIDDAGYARLRREKAAAEKRAKEAEEKLNKKVNPEAEEENPLNREVLDLIQQNRVQKAEREFIVLESDFASKTPDYHDVSNGYKEALYQSLRIQNPRKSHPELLELTKNTLLMKAGDYAARGFDPIEEMYQEARSLGFKKVEKQAAEAVEEKEEPKKASLDAIARNKARNAGMAAAQGNKGGGGQLTAESLAGMSTAEFMKIPKAERDRALKALF